MEVFVAKVCLLRSNGKSAADIPSKRRGAEKSGLAIIPKVHCWTGTTIAVEDSHPHSNWIAFMSLCMRK